MITSTWKTLTAWAFELIRPGDVAELNRKRAGETLLHTAICLCDHNLVRKLIEAGADADLVLFGEFGGVSPLEWTIEFDEVEILKVLIDTGKVAEEELRDKVQPALLDNSEKIARFLVFERGVRVTADDINGAELCGKSQALSVVFDALAADASLWDGVELGAFSDAAVRWSDPKAAILLAEAFRRGLELNFFKEKIGHADTLAVLLRHGAKPTENSLRVALNDGECALVQALLRHLCDDPALCSSSAAKCTEAAFFFLVDRGVDVCALRDAFCRAALAGNVPLVERFIARGFTIEFGEFLLRGGCKALTELIAKHSGGKCLDAALHLCLQDLDVERSLFLVKLGAKLAPPHRMMQGTYDVLTGAIAAGLMSIGGDDWRWFLTNGASWPAVQDPLFDLLCCVGTPSFLLFLMLDAVPCAAPFADPFCFAGGACRWTRTCGRRRARVRSRLCSVQLCASIACCTGGWQRKNSS
jgi:hypothetical protein